HVGGELRGQTHPARLFQHTVVAPPNMLTDEPQGFGNVEPRASLLKFGTLEHLDIQRTKLTAIANGQFAGGDGYQRAGALAPTRHDDAEPFLVVVPKASSDPVAAIRVAAIGGEEYGGALMSAAR